MRARACQAALGETWRFSRGELLGQLKGKENGRTKRTALLNSYGRMFSWVHSMVKLGSDDGSEPLIAQHALGLAACLRAIFEIFLDTNLLRDERIEEGPEKFFSFEKVARHKIAQNSLELDKEFKHLTLEQRSQMTAYAGKDSGLEGEITSLVTRLWGLTKKGKPNRPEHWTGMTVIDRVKSVGGDCIHYYQHSYHYCNWSLHSGYTDFLMATEERASLFCALLYTFANEMFRFATEIMIGEFAEFLQVEALKNQLKKVQLRGAHVLWDAAVEAEKTKAGKAG